MTMSLAELVAVDAVEIPKALDVVDRRSFLQTILFGLSYGEREREKLSPRLGGRVFK